MTGTQAVRQDMGLLNRFGCNLVGGDGSHLKPVSFKGLISQTIGIQKPGKTGCNQILGQNMSTGDFLGIQHGIGNGAIGNIVSGNPSIRDFVHGIVPTGFSIGDGGCCQHIGCE